MGRARVIPLQGNTHLITTERDIAFGAGTAELSDIALEIAQVLPLHTIKVTESKSVLSTFPTRGQI